jgi:hypothetical protein
MDGYPSSISLIISVSSKTLICSSNGALPYRNTLITAGDLGWSEYL